MMDGPGSPIIFWFRRDLRLADHPGFFDACRSGRPVLPVFIADESVSGLGAAPKWRLGLGLEVFSRALMARGSRLILRRGPAAQVLRDLLQETGADAVWWSRLYDPQAQARDSAIKSDLKTQGVDARSFAGHLLFEPWSVSTGSGGYYKVYSAMWRAVQGREIAAALPPPAQIPPPAAWPRSDDLQTWRLGAAMNRGAAVVQAHVAPGEDAARARLDAFVETAIADYKELRDVPALDATSRLSDYLSLGEISPRLLWHAGQRARDARKTGAEHFLKEVVWREFAYHLMYHAPHMLSGNWKEGWDRFPWQTEADAPEVQAWKQGRTGIPFVDAAMRELYVTGRMHNRARMIVASYLTKHLMTHWKVGMDWFADCLVDWDPAANAMGWQWVAGSGPDATPYFRVFNPDLQQKKFDPDGVYVARWLAETQADPPETALSYFRAVPRAWGVAADDPYPDPVMALDEGRKRALAAYQLRSV
ncbi:DNA photolyase family protein [Ruegeria sp. 2012CJ41-6]|uniref:DNA photolyase family protein n=1 Tax=Ruegeria spongiae TaxID=2942209 RepID=A0ABT0Q345_9RHOB|nr:deoxyribodipyrimidine photo-lyase [Ruegeria spongiae]MCL6284256.1 DNA photolyase family protein [Ruegeria spongiae]